MSGPGGVLLLLALGVFDYDTGIYWFDNDTGAMHFYVLFNIIDLPCGHELLAHPDTAP